jgi:hypothetical protein
VTSTTGRPPDATVTTASPMSVPLIRRGAVGLEPTGSPDESVARHGNPRCDEARWGDP